MSGAEEKIVARFRVTQSQVIITAKFHDVTAQLSWKREEDDVETTRQINALLSNLPSMVQDGIREVQIKAAMQDIDAEHEALFNHPEGEPNE